MVRWNIIIRIIRIRISIKKLRKINKWLIKWRKKFRIKIIIIRWLIIIILKKNNNLRLRT